MNDQQAAQIATKRLAAMDLESDKVSIWSDHLGHQIAG
jgi:hypothetical protein